MSDSDLSVSTVESRVYSVQKFIDEQRIGAPHRWILLICALVMAVDAFDVFAVGKIAPAIAAGFHVRSSAMTTVFLMQQIGLAIGAFAATPLADRYGRQRMVILFLVAFGLASLLSSFATGLQEFAILRGVAGVFLAGLLPIVIALIAESVPRRRQGTYIAIGFVAYSAGSAAGGVLAVWLLDHYGWQSVYMVGATVPLLLVPLVVLVVPESLPFLAETGASIERIRTVMRKLDPTCLIPETTVFRLGVAKAIKRTRIATLFDNDHRRKTFFLWAATFLSMGCIALVAAWLPTLFQEMAGIPIKRFALYSLIGFIGGFAGSLSAGWLLDRTSATAMAPIYFSGLAVSLLLLGWLSSATVFVAAVVLFNFFQSGGQAVLNTLMSQAYPTGIRSTGLGWAGGLGRIGGIVLPLFGGFALESHYSIGTTMALIALIPAGVVMLMLTQRAGTVTLSLGHRVI